MSPLMVLLFYTEVNSISSVIKIQHKKTFIPALIVISIFLLMGIGIITVESEFTTGNSPNNGNLSSEDITINELCGPECGVPGRYIQDSLLSRIS